MKKNTTIYDISKALDLSPSTVSRALNNHPRISSKTKELVTQKADELGYHQNHLAASLRTGTSNTIGVVVPFMRHNLFSRVVSSLEEVLAQQHLNLIITQSHEELTKEIANLDVLIKAQVMGIIISVSKQTINLEHFKKVVDQNIPMILFDRITEAENINKVMINDFKGAYLATEHLINNGYKRIAHFTVSKTLKIYKDRLEGYKQALLDYQQEFDEQLIKMVPSDIETGKLAMKKLLDLPKPPDALFSSSDYSALGAFKILKERQITIPKEFGIVGFSNEPFTGHISPSLSSVDQKPLQMGREIGNAILSLIDKTKAKTIANGHETLVLDPVLIIRESSSRLK